MLWAWVCICSFCAVVIDAVAGTWGLALPALASAAFYLTVVTGWRGAVFPLMAAACLTDVLNGHCWPSSVILTVPVMLVALLWRRHGDCRHIGVQAALGAAIGLGYHGGVMLLEVVLVETWGWAMIRHGLRVLAGACVSGLVVMPLLCRCLDGLAHGLALPRLADVRRSGGPHVR